MSVREIGRLLRRQGLLLLLCVVVGVGVGYAVAKSVAPVYQAQAQLFVSGRSATGGIPAAASASSYAEQQIASYVDIVTTPLVTGPVIQRLGLKESPATLAKQLAVANPTGTVLLNISATDPSAVGAQRIAQAIADQATAVIEKLETPQGAPSPLVKVTVVRPAALPAGPQPSRKVADVVLGLLAGLGIGIGGAALRETLDTTVGDPEEVTSLVSRPVLAAVPADSSASKHPLALLQQPHGPRAEAYRQLRTNFQFVAVDKRPRSLVVTSSRAGEGKTHTAVNLAVAFVQAGMRVLIIDADLRKPRVASVLGLEGAVGLTNVLTGRVTIVDALQAWGDGQLLVLPAGEAPPNPSELLASKAMAALLAQAENGFDMVILDSAPLLPVADTAALTTIAGGTLLVVRHGVTRREQIRGAVELLTPLQARLLGTVLNVVPARAGRSYGYGYRYPSAAESARPSRRRPGAKPPVAARGSRRGGPRAGGEADATSESLIPKATESTSAPGRGAAFRIEPAERRWTGPGNPVGNFGDQGAAGDHALPEP